MHALHLAELRSQSPLCLPRCLKSVFCKAPSTQKVTVFSHWAAAIHVCSSRRNSEQWPCGNISWPAPSLLLPQGAAGTAVSWEMLRGNGLQAQSSARTLLCSGLALTSSSWFWSGNERCGFLPSHAHLETNFSPPGRQDLQTGYCKKQIYFLVLKDFVLFRREWALILHYIGTSVYFSLSLFRFIEFDIVLTFLKKKQCQLQTDCF